MNALDKIVQYKQDEVARLKSELSISSLDSQIKNLPDARGFQNALYSKMATGQNALICELKRKSPSAGDILPGANPVEIAQEYEAGGAACLSVLTDEPSFGGSLQDLKNIRKAVSIPLLRKDFMIDPIQVYEARAFGADCILLIMSVLSDSHARELFDCAQTCGLDVLTEVHDEQELDRATELDMPLIGINNRDLKRMITDLSTSERLAVRTPHLKMVSESGVKTTDDILRLRKAGFEMFLIGESLMKETNRELAVHSLVNARKD